MTNQAANVRLGLNFGNDAAKNEHDGRIGLGAGNSAIVIDNSAALGSLEQRLSKIEHGSSKIPRD